MATVFLNRCCEVLISSSHTNNSRTQFYFSQTIFFKKNCLLYFGVQSHCKKNWWRLLFSFKTSSFKNVDRSASSWARGDTTDPYHKPVVLPSFEEDSLLPPPQCKDSQSQIYFAYYNLDCRSTFDRATGKINRHRCVLLTWKNLLSHIYFACYDPVLSVVPNLPHAQFCHVQTRFVHSAVFKYLMFDGKEHIFWHISTILDGINYLLIGCRSWRIITDHITKPTTKLYTENNGRFDEWLEYLDSKNHQILTWLITINYKYSY